MWLGKGEFPEEDRKEKYDVAVAAGVFLVGHMPKESIGEIYDAIKKGGYWVTAMRQQYYVAG